MSTKAPSPSQNKFDETPDYTKELLKDTFHLRKPDLQKGYAGLKKTFDPILSGLPALCLEVVHTPPPLRTAASKGFEERCQSFSRQIDLAIDAEEKLWKPNGYCPEKIEGILLNPIAMKAVQRNWMAKRILQIELEETITDYDFMANHAMGLLEICRKFIHSTLPASDLLDQCLDRDILEMEEAR